MKKALLSILASLAFSFSVAHAAGFQETTSASGTVNLVVTDNAGTVEIHPDTILVGTVSAKATVVDLFQTLSFDGKSVEKADFLKNIDVRYKSAEMDNKISANEDEIPANSTVYVLFKTAEQGGLLNGPIATVQFKLDKFALTTVGKIGQVGNSYEKTMSVVSQAAPVVTAAAPQPPVQPISVETLKTNNTGTKENVFMLAFAAILFAVAFAMPKLSKSNAK